MRAVALVALAAVLGGCADHSKPFSSPGGVAGGPLRVLVSISVFESFARGVGGDRIVVDSFVPRGSSPEVYRASSHDIDKIHNADVLFENGLGLENGLKSAIERAEADHLRVCVLTGGLPAKNGNPHLWMDPMLARRYVEKMRDILSDVDPAGADFYATNAAAYEAKLDALRAGIASDIASIPRASRAMIVYHNAWQYFDDRFGLRTLGVLERSPGREPLPDDLARLARLAQANHVRAVFAEPEYPPKIADRFANLAGIATIEDLYDDSFDSTGKISDYESMLRYDARTIAGALGGER